LTGKYGERRIGIVGAFGSTVRRPWGHPENVGKIDMELELNMVKGPVSGESASASIDEKIEGLGDWRGKTLANVRKIIHEADPEIVEEWKWMGTPVWSHGGIVCTGETYKNVVKMTFPKGAALEDPSGLFNSSLDGNARRAIDIHEGAGVDEAALKDLVRAAVALNLEGKSNPKPRRAGS
jgi:hypothetical protein